MAGTRGTKADGPVHDAQCNVAWCRTMWLGPPLVVLRTVYAVPDTCLWNPGTVIATSVSYHNMGDILRFPTGSSVDTPSWRVFKSTTPSGLLVLAPLWSDAIGHGRWGNTAALRCDGRWKSARRRRAFCRSQVMTK